MVRELEAQLEYERVRREKLESQLDDCRAEIARLKECLGKVPVSPLPTRVSAAFCPVPSQHCFGECVKRECEKFGGRTLLPC